MGRTETPAWSKGLTLPKVTIVMPNFNYGRFIEAAIRSVLLQCYPNLEFIVMDAGSADESVEILTRYERWITHWESAPDKGQSSAINKGLGLATGDVFNWLNSDDQLAPGALWEIARVWVQNKPDVIVGGGLAIEADTRCMLHEWVARAPDSPLDFLEPHRVVMCQPATFLSVDVLRRVGGVKEELHYLMDWDLYLRLSAQLREDVVFCTTSKVIAYWFSHPGAKSNKERAGFRKEASIVLADLRQFLTPAELLRLRTHLLCTRVTECVDSLRTLALSGLLTIKKTFRL